VTEDLITSADSSEKKENDLGATQEMGRCGVNPKMEGGGVSMWQGRAYTDLDLTRRGGAGRQEEKLVGKTRRGELGAFGWLGTEEKTRGELKQSVCKGELDEIKVTGGMLVERKRGKPNEAEGKKWIGLGPRRR